MANSNHTDEILVEAMQMLKEHGTQAAAARAVGIPESTFNKRITAAQARGLTAASKPKTENERLVKELRKQLEQQREEQDTAAKIREHIYGIAARDPEPPQWLYRPQGGGKRGVPCVLGSDWHYGEVVNSVEVNGLNRFNSKIAADRIKLMTHLTTELCYEHMGRAKYEYPGIVLMYGGDMISGDIHEELLATNDKTPQQCINDLTDLMAAQVETLATNFGKIFVPCVVGNHGRATRKPRMKGRVFTSHEWNIYCNLARSFRGSKHVQFLIPDQTDAHFSIVGHRYLLTHGDALGVKGGDGIIGSLGPIMRGAIKVGRSESQVGRDFDTLVMGHWHQYLTLPGLIVNNALKGYDEFARLALRAPYSRPSQALWFTHPSHGITAHWQVYLDALREADANKKAPWVQWRE